ncbi:MAG: sigma-70 family RNA polymerase sigma factor [Gemmataceae bacterium]
MATAALDSIRKVFDGVRDSAGHADGELLTRYRTVRDQDAFGSLVRRHGPMVLGVCRRVLRDSHAADDAFQATFLVLARKADAVRPPDRLAPWLYGVAYRTALKARGRAFRQQQVEQEYAADTTIRSAATPSSDADLLPVIDEQLNALPEKYRTPLVLCGVQGLNKVEAAERLGLPEGTVSSRLARAREMLRERLGRRGVVVPSAALAVLLTAESLQAAVPATLTTSTTGIGLGSSTIPASVLTLSQEVIRSMTLLKLPLVATIAMTLSMVGGGFGLLAIQADDKKPQPVPNEVKKPQPVPNGDKKPQPVPGDPVKKPAGPNEKNGDNNQNGKNEKNGDNNQKGEGNKAKPALRGAGKVAAVNAKENTITLAVKGDGGIVERQFKLAAGVKVLVDGKDAKLADVPVGAFASLVGGNKEGGDIPEVRVSMKGDGEKPVKPAGKFGGKVSAVDAAAKTISIAGKGEAGDIVVKLTADAKIMVDGKAAKLGDVAKGGFATFTIVSAKDGQAREASEVAVTGMTFGGSIKQIDSGSVTIGNEKFDRVVKLAAGGKVMVNGKDAKVADLKVGDRVMVTLTSDESGAVLIVAGGKPEGDKPRPDGDKPKPAGDKPKPEKASPEGE